MMHPLHFGGTRGRVIGPAIGPFPDGNPAMGDLVARAGSGPRGALHPAEQCAAGAAEPKGGP